jgi:hypothetical protein
MRTNKTAMNLATGNVVSVANLHDALRKPTGPDPVKAARAVAKIAVATVRKAKLATSGSASAAAATVTVTGDAEPLPADGPARSNVTRRYVLARLAQRGGATLAELTKAAGWRAPYEAKNLHKLAAGQGKAVAHDGAKGVDRRYWLA